MAIMPLTFDISNRSQADALEKLSWDEKREITTITLRHRGNQRLELISLTIQNFPSLISLNMPNGLKIQSLLIRQCHNLKEIQIPQRAYIKTLKVDDVPKFQNIQLEEGSMVNTLSLKNIKSGLSFTFMYRAKINTIVHHYMQDGQDKVHMEQNITQSGTFDF